MRSTDLLREAHHVVYASHPSSTKMYQDLEEDYWYSEMKKVVAKVVFQCLNDNV